MRLLLTVLWWGLAFSAFSSVAKNEHHYQIQVNIWANCSEAQQRAAVAHLLMEATRNNLPSFEEKSAPWTTAAVILSGASAEGQLISDNLLGQFYREASYPLIAQYFEMFSAAKLRQVAPILFKHCIAMGEVYIMDLLKKRVIEVKEHQILIDMMGTRYTDLNVAIIIGDLDSEIMESIYKPSLAYLYWQQGESPKSFELFKRMSPTDQERFLRTLEPHELLQFLQTYLNHASLEHFSQLIPAVNVYRMIEQGDYELAKFLFMKYNLDFIKYTMKVSRSNDDQDFLEAFGSVKIGGGSLEDNAFQVLEKWHRECTQTLASTSSTTSYWAGSSTSSTSTSSTPSHFMEESLDLETNLPAPPNSVNQSYEGDETSSSSHEINYDADDEGSHGKKRRRSDEGLNPAKRRRKDNGHAQRGMPARKRERDAEEMPEAKRRKAYETSAPKKSNEQ